MPTKPPIDPGFYHRPPPGGSRPPTYGPTPRERREARGDALVNRILRGRVSPWKP